MGQDAGLEGHLSQTCSGGGVFILPFYVLVYQVNPGAGVWASVVGLVSLLVFCPPTTYALIGVHLTSYRPCWISWASGEGEPWHACS